MSLDVLILSLLEYSYETSATVKLVLKSSDAKYSESCMDINNFGLNCITITSKVKNTYDFLSLFWMLIDSLSILSRIRRAHVPWC